MYVIRKIFLIFNIFFQILSCNRASSSHVLLIRTYLLSFVLTHFQSLICIRFAHFLNTFSQHCLSSLSTLSLGPFPLFICGRIGNIFSNLKDPKIHQALYLKKRGNNVILSTFPILFLNSNIFLSYLTIVLLI